MKVRQVENAEVWKPNYENVSAETEVRKWEQKLLIMQCLVPYWLMTVPCSQRVTVSKWCESQVLMHWTPASTNTVV